MLSRIAVVVPAHDEEVTLPACLESIRRSAALVPVPVEVIVVADGCTDGTAGVALAGGARLVEVDARNVGRARAAGMDEALRHGAAGLWLATTDADSRVADGWLRWHHEHAERGTPFLAGTVAVADWTPWPDAVRIAYDGRYADAVTGTVHRHVHGANLGCDAAAYRRIGGFADLRHDEDRDLVTRAAALGHQVVHDASCPVLTSARRVARAPAGFAAHLAGLAEICPDG